MTSNLDISIDQWANTALLHPSWLRPEEQAAINIIRDLLRTRTTPQVAATSIASTYEARVRSGDPQLWYLWTAVCDAVQHIGYKIDHLSLLAKMLRAISKVPDVLDDKGHPIKQPTRAQIYWRDMPSFAYCFSETAIDHVLLEDLDRGLGVNRDSAIQRLLNGNVFGALYLLELDPDGPRYDFWYFRKLALDHFMYALEVTTETHYQIRRAEVYIPPAAMWILIAGRNIYRYCKADQDYKGEDVYQRWIGGEHGSELTFLGKDGFNLDRWMFWRTRFEHISMLERINRDVMEYAVQAAREMRKIEQGLDLA
ncbi:MAG: hypothetical protein LQ349_008997 [Xanthoria aureola]|nr:MAG: hypothetical protein LQ349_008997 [Xanthoria aureola]